MLVTKKFILLVYNACLTVVLFCFIIIYYEYMIYIYIYKVYTQTHFLMLFVDLFDSVCFD